MATTSLSDFITALRADWAGLDSETIGRTHELLRELTGADSAEPWHEQLHSERPATVELYRDPDHGFVLLGHTEPSGSRFAPHDHGAGWVFYAVQHGKTRMETYKSITSPVGDTTLVSRGAFTLGPGDSQVFLPRDIHSTEVVSDYLVQIRLTSCDFAIERSEGRMIRYPDRATPTPAVA